MTAISMVKVMKIIHEHACKKKIHAVVNFKKKKREIFHWLVSKIESTCMPPTVM